MSPLTAAATVGIPGWAETALIFLFVSLAAAAGAWGAEREHGADAWRDPGGWRFPKAEIAGLRTSGYAWAICAAAGILLRL